MNICAYNLSPRPQATSDQLPPFMHSIHIWVPTFVSVEKFEFQSNQNVDSIILLNDLGIKREGIYESQIENMSIDFPKSFWGF